MNFEEFKIEINRLPKNYENRDLETYLLAIFKNLEDNRESYIKENATLDLILFILKEAFTSEPAQFNEEWLNITQSPRSKQSDINNLTAIEGIEFTKDVLRFQIAELYKMKDKQLKNEHRYFGIKSETGHYWYNFTPFDNLDCGTQCMYDNEDIVDSIDWSFIGNLLEDGRIYE